MQDPQQGYNWTDTGSTRASLTAVDTRLPMLGDQIQEPGPKPSTQPLSSSEKNMPFSGLHILLCEMGR